MISGSPIQGARPDGENQENSYSPPHPGSGIFKTQNRHSIYADNVNAVYKISPHLYGKFYLRLLLSVDVYFENSIDNYVLFI